MLTLVEGKQRSTSLEDKWTGELSPPLACYEVMGVMFFSPSFFSTFNSQEN